MGHEKLANCLLGGGAGRESSQLRCKPGKGKNRHVFCFVFFRLSIPPLLCSSACSCRTAAVCLPSDSSVCEGGKS